MKYQVPSVNFIDKVGIELEGGWKYDRVDRGLHVYGDGSVQIARSYDAPDNVCGCRRSNCHVCNPCDDRSCCSPRPTLPRDALLAGEICSRPLHPADAIDWMIDSYPDVSNNTCGLHVHTSFRSMLRYAQLMDEPFYRHFRVQFGEWAKQNVGPKSPFWERWAGNNRYCKDAFIPDDQFHHVTKGYERYTQLNYAYSVRSIDHESGARNTRGRRTLECRLFPVFPDKTLAAAAVCRYFSIIEDYLRNKADETESPIEQELKDETADEPIKFIYKADPDPTKFAVPDSSRRIRTMSYWDSDGPILDRDYRTIDDPPGSRPAGIPSGWLSRSRRVGGIREIVWLPPNAPLTNFDE